VPLTSKHVSDVIGAIYDSVLLPEQWPTTLSRLADEMSCHGGSITIMERTYDPPKLVSLIASDGIEQRWIDQHRVGNYGADAAPFFAAAMAQPGYDIDMPLVVSRVIPVEQHGNMRVFREWASPQGFVDCLSAVVLDSPARLATVDMMRHESVGFADDISIATLRLFAPHLRRAITISNLIDLADLEKVALSATLDHLAPAVVIVGIDARILHCNGAARELFRRGDPVLDHDNILTASSPQCTMLLHNALNELRSGAPRTTSARVAIALTTQQEAAAKPPTQPTLAYVLPLGLGPVGSRLVPGAVAAILITTRTTAPPSSIHAATIAFNFTTAEARLASQLMTGASIGEAAEAMAIEISTARTHLSRIFAKSGTTRQAELVALLLQLAGPLPEVRL
jgi:DNA-binding CsgD family transcriptional regulator/PAS domain-containing protein